MLLHPYFDEYHWTGFREQNLIAEELFEFSGLDCLDYEQSSTATRSSKLPISLPASA